MCAICSGGFTGMKTPCVLQGCDRGVEWGVGPALQTRNLCCSVEHAEQAGIEIREVDLEEVERSKRGFASMDPERQREIASEGGKKAHAEGTAHQWTPEEAREAGKRAHVIHPVDPDAMREIARKGGLARAARAKERAEAAARGEALPSPPPRIRRSRPPRAIPNPDNRPLCRVCAERPVKKGPTGALLDRCGSCVYRSNGVERQAPATVPEPAPVAAPGKTLPDLRELTQQSVIHDALEKARGLLDVVTGADTVTVPITVTRAGLKRIGSPTFRDKDGQAL